MNILDENKPGEGIPEIDEATQDPYLIGHDYDGIRELDNKLPRWWLYLFYFTIIFSVVYLIGYHVTEWWPLQEKEYAIEMSAAIAAQPPDPFAKLDLESMVPMADAADLAAGEEIYQKICVTCHGKFGEGLVGPNFTDMYWIHGDSTSSVIHVKDLFTVIVNGVIEKGMISYKDQLTPEQMQQVIGFIFTLQNTNPPNQKGPEGKLYETIG